MPRQQKIKRSRGVGRSSYKARPHPLTVLVTIAVIVGLVFVGISIYEPVYNLITGNLQREPARGNEIEDDISRPDPEPVEPEPEIPDTVQGLRAVYIPHATVADNGALNAFLDTLSGTDINAVMVDIKDQNGTVLYNTGNAHAITSGAVAENAFDLGALNNALNGRGLHLIARMSAFRDEPAARGEAAEREDGDTSDFEYGIRYQDLDMLWLDNYANAGGKPWLNPYAPGTQAYLAGLAEEVAAAGAAMVVLLDYQFPDYSDSANANFGGWAQGVSRAEVLRGYAQELEERLGEYGTRLSVYYSASTFTADSEYRYGGSAMDALGGELVAGLLPYQFTNGYAEDGLEIDSPLDDPANTVTLALRYVQNRLRGDIQVVALIQGGNEATITGSMYTAQTVRAQIDALAALGVEEYILYCQDAGAYLLG